MTVRSAVLALLALLLAACSATGTRSPAPGTAPLLAMAESRHYLEPLRRQRHEAAVLAAQAMLGAYAERGDADSCEGASCADDHIETLRELAVAYSQLGLHRMSFAVYQAVLAQRPDEATSYEDVAAEQMFLGRDEDAARNYERALELSRKSHAPTLGLAATFSLLTDDLARARARFESCVRLGKPARTVQYCAIGLAVVKTRGGNDSLLLAVTPASSWPGPLLAHLRGEIDEAALAKRIASSEPDTQREHLSEALYHVGESHLARGDRAQALRCFRANQALRVEAFFETEASARRIRQLGGADDPEPAPVPAQHAPIG